MRKRFMRHSMRAMLGLLAFLARRPREAAELGPLWQRSFPSPKQVPIERVEGNTVFAQIPML